MIRNSRRLILISIGILLANIEITGQFAFLSDNARIYSIIDRFDVLYGSNDAYHTSVRRNDAYLLYNNIKFHTSQVLSARQKEDLDYVLAEIPETRVLEEDTLTNSFHPIKNRGFLGLFYKTPYSFLEFKNDEFYLEIDPVFDFSIGEATRDQNFIFQNTRGIKVRGLIDSKVYFYSSILENQRQFLYHIEDLIKNTGAIPGQGFYKPYQSKIFSGLTGWDYLNAEAYLGLPVSKSINLQLGHGNNFIGNGYQSLLLQDYAHNYFYLKLNVVFWKIHYQTIFGELSAISHKDNIGNELLPKKYMAVHYLDIRFHKNLNIGLFEAVVFGREDHFEFQYLNPVILYRSVEQFLDSPDNVIIGLNIKWNFLRKYQFYSQLVFDEFKTSELVSGDGWWGNKLGIQLGLKLKNLLDLENLDIQLEYNRVRPYTYAHRTTASSPELSIGSYSHYNLPLAHPLGANFKELIFLASYQPTEDLFLKIRLLKSNYGEDPLGENFGKNILKDYNTRVSDYGNFTAQGINTDVYLFALKISKEFFHNYYFDIDYLYRSQSSVEASSNKETHYLGIGFRANIFYQNLDY